MEPDKFSPLERLLMELLVDRPECESVLVELHRRVAEVEMFLASLSNYPATVEGVMGALRQATAGYGGCAILSAELATTLKAHRAVTLKFIVPTVATLN